MSTTTSAKRHGFAGARSAGGLGGPLGAPHLTRLPEEPAAGRRLAVLALEEDAEVGLHGSLTEARGGELERRRGRPRRHVLLRARAELAGRQIHDRREELLLDGEAR